MKRKPKNQGKRPTKVRIQGQDFGIDMAQGVAANLIAAPAANPAIAKFQSRGYRRGEEVKTLDTYFSGAYAGAYVPDTLPAQVLNISEYLSAHQAVNLVQAGTGVSQRIGNKISLKSLRLRMTLASIGANSNPYGTYARLVVLYDRNCNGTYVPWTSLFQYMNGDGTLTNGDFTASLSPSNFDRVVILMDKLISVSPKIPSAPGGETPGSYSATENGNFMIDEYINLKDLETIFNGTANPAQITQVQTGALIIFSIGDQLAANAVWTWEGLARLRFRDN